MCMPVKIAKCAQYTVEALVPFFTKVAQRQMCFGLKVYNWWRWLLLIFPNLIFPNFEQLVCRCVRPDGRGRQGGGGGLSPKFPECSFLNCFVSNKDVQEVVSASPIAGGLPTQNPKMTTGPLIWIPII